MAPAVPIPWVRISFVDVIPIWWIPEKSCTVDDKPPTFTKTEFCKFKDVDAIPINSSPNLLTNFTPDIDSFETLISDNDPFNLETLALASKLLSTFLSKTILSLTF